MVPILDVDTVSHEGASQHGEIRLKERHHENHRSKNLSG